MPGLNSNEEFILHHFSCIFVPMASARTERKCDSCGSWIMGTPRICPDCGDFLNHRQREQEQKLTAKVAQVAIEREAFESKTFLGRIVHRFFVALEFIFVTVIGGISAFLFWLGG
jgi:predicted amidophosphoribosyltransferase